MKKVSDQHETKEDRKQAEIKLTTRIRDIAVQQTHWALNRIPPIIQKALNMPPQTILAKPMLAPR
ncbi:hypothetical protein MD484_g5783, partial [Candolleomyces efflorescens]